jgi:hypothetical protein
MDASASTVVSDGCSGFQWTEWVFPAVRDCCFSHDLGGSNGQLLDCLQSVLPHWAYVIAGFFVALMILVRPLYRLLTRK